MPFSLKQSDLRNTILSITRQVPEGKSELGTHSNNVDPFTYPSYTTLKHAPLEAIAAVTWTRIQALSKKAEETAASESIPRFLDGH